MQRDRGRVAVHSAAAERALVRIKRCAVDGHCRIRSSFDGACRSTVNARLPRIRAVALPFACAAFVSLVLCCVRASFVLEDFVVAEGRVVNGSLNATITVESTTSP